MDSLSTVIGVLAPVAVAVIIVVALRAIVRADRRENEAIAAMDTRRDDETHVGRAGPQPPVREPLPDRRPGDDETRGE